MINNDDVNAFPREDYQTDSQQGQSGMTLRDYFAAKALQSIITDGKLGKLLVHEDYIKKVSEMSYEYADAMIEARKKK